MDGFNALAFVPQYVSAMRVVTVAQAEAYATEKPRDSFRLPYG